MRTRRTGNRGQVTVEIGVVFVVVVMALVLLASYLQRGYQGGLKSNADSFGTQFSAENAWTLTSNSTTHEDQTTITSTQASQYDQSM